MYNPIKTKLKGFSTFQTQAYPWGSEVGAGVGFSLQFSFMWNELFLSSLWVTDKK